MLVSFDFKTSLKMFTQRGKYVTSMSFISFHFMNEIISLLCLFCIVINYLTVNFNENEKKVEYTFLEILNHFVMI